MADSKNAAASRFVEQQREWPARPWLLAALGAVAGVAVNLLLEGESDAAWPAAIAAAIFFAAASAAFVLQPQGWRSAAIFAAALGLVMGGVAWMAVDTGDHLAGEEFAFAAGVFFSLLAIPLYQAGFHRRRWATPYEETHFYVWTDAVSAGGAGLFVLLSWALFWLLDALFGLVGASFAEDLIDIEGFVGLFIGAAFGAAMGVLRNQLSIIGTLQRVVMLIFALLAVPFALAILLFLLILLFSAGAALWEATDSATPVLLTCALGCFILANAVVRDDDEARSDSRVMLAAAAILAAGIFPLTVFAAISMGLRIDQHGLSPERLWALVAIAIATAYGLAYWVGLARGRLAGWSAYLRRANLHLAVASCVLALILAFPLLDFGRISANNQLSRLQAGEVSAEDFDYSALRWDFGDAGRRILAHLAEGEGRVAELAQAAAEQKQPTDRYYNTREEDTRRANLRVQSDDPYWEARIREHFADLNWHCNSACYAIDLGFDEGGDRKFKLIEHTAVTDWSLKREEEASEVAVQVPAQSRRTEPLTADSTVEIREWSGRRIYVDGEPMGEPFP